MDFPVGQAAQFLSLLTPELTSSLDTRGMTLIRTILGFSVFPHVPGAVNGIQAVDVGIQVVSEEGFNAAVVPDPSDSTETPRLGWIFRGRYMVVDSVDSHDGPYQRYDFDIHSMRKIDQGKLHIAIDNTSSQGTTFTVRLAGLVRCLIKMP